MQKYLIRGTVRVPVYTIVESENREEAESLAADREVALAQGIAPTSPDEAWSLDATREYQEVKIEEAAQ